MNDKARPGHGPGDDEPAVMRIARWAVWIVILVLTVWVFVDLAVSQ